MNKFLHNLSIRTRMLLSVSLFLATHFYSMADAYQSIGANVDFAVLEKKGDVYQRPLAALLRDTGKLRLALAAGTDTAGTMAAIDKDMADLKAVQDAVGADLQFTDEGLDSRGRGNLKYAVVLKKWQDAESAIKAAPGKDNDAALASLVADLRGMTSHSGDTSNLILDPDLDSYYLMDITLAVLPQALDRAASAAAQFLPKMAGGHALGDAAKTDAAVMSRTMEESDLARAAGDLDTALKEDRNFHGMDESFQTSTPPLLQDFSARNQALADILGRMGRGAEVAPADFAAAAAAALDADYAFLARGYDELDGMLDARMRDYRAQQARAVAIALAGVVAAMIFYLLVVRSITRPLNELTATMGRLAASDLSAEVPYAGVRSEIGEIAASLQVFKQHAIDKMEMEKAQKAAEAKASQERRQARQALAQDFEDRVKGIIDAVAAAAAGLSDTANDMASFIAKSAQKSDEASRGANTTNQNMQSVAAAADEMAVTVREISAQVQRTNQFIADSVQKSAGASQYASSLQEASQKVRDVTRLIAEIAGQTNLLALNATIEAARAGEAGKGFAVVANEVKNLASQTDKSIQDIERVIAEMSSATEGVVTALTGIKDSVDRIFETSSGIASAVEEQSATVSDIVKSMQTASDGTIHVSENIQVVAQLSGEASQSSQQVLVAANDLNARAEQLDMEVASFLAEVRG